MNSKGNLTLVNSHLLLTVIDLRDSPLVINFVFLSYGVDYNLGELLVVMFY